MPSCLLISVILELEHYLHVCADQALCDRNLLLTACFACVADAQPARDQISLYDTCLHILHVWICGAYNHISGHPRARQVEEAEAGGCLC